MRFLIRPQVTAQAAPLLTWRNVEVELRKAGVFVRPVAVFVRPDPENLVNVLLRHLPMSAVRRYSEEDSVALHGTHADAPQEAAPRHLIELRDAMGQHRRVMVRNAAHAGCE